jgi:hypothetical protein
MGHPIFQPADPTKWSLLYSQQFAVERYNARQYQPIPPQRLPILAENRVLVVGSASQRAKATWKHGGILHAMVNTGATPFQLADVASYRLGCNQAKLIILPAIASTYQLRFEIPSWFEEVNLTIFEYLGPVTDSTENLIAELQSSVNQLL